jgi:hypothetical protein
MEDEMKRVLLTGLFILLVSAIHIYAEPLGSNLEAPYINLNGILNPSNIKMNHTMSFMTGMSSGGEGYYQSVYTNHLLFDLHPKIDLQLDLNFVNYGTANWDSNFSVKANDDNQSQILPEFSLQYRPTERTSIRVEFRSMKPYQRNDNWWW